MEEAPKPDQERSDDAPADDDGSSGSRRSYSKGLAAGYTLAGGLVVGLGIGWAIDASLGTAPLWTVCGALLFMLAGLYQVVKDNLKK